MVTGINADRACESHSLSATPLTQTSFLNIIKSFTHSIPQIGTVIPNTTYFTGTHRTNPASTSYKQYLQMAISLLTQIKYSQENCSLFFLYIPPPRPRKQHVRKTSKQISKITSGIRQTQVWIIDYHILIVCNWVSYLIFSASIISSLTRLTILTLEGLCEVCRCMSVWHIG